MHVLLPTVTIFTDNPPLLAVSVGEYLLSVANYGDYLLCLCCSVIGYYGGAQHRIVDTWSKWATSTTSQSPVSAVTHSGLFILSHLLQHIISFLLTSIIFSNKIKCKIFYPPLPQHIMQGEIIDTLSVCNHSFP